MSLSKKLWLKRISILMAIITVSVISTQITISKMFHTNTPVALAQENPHTLSPNYNGGDFQENLRHVAEQTLQGVVRVDVTSLKKIMVRPQRSPWGFFFGQDFYNRFQEEEGEEREFRSSGFGSGFIIERENNNLYILTNYHVAGEANQITIHFRDGRNFTAEILAVDERRDIALLKVNVGKGNDDLRPLPLGDSNALAVGDWVLAAGSPIGYDFTVTAGIVSALGRRGPRSNINDFIQTDASINQGNSGGPLVNMRGEVIGINTWIATQNGGFIGLSFSAPINNAKEALPFLKQGKTPEYGWIGVIPHNIKDLGGENYAKSAGFNNTKGAVVIEVVRNGAAEKGGLLPGDLIISVNDQPINDENRLVYIVGSLPAGSKADFKVIRDGQEKNITIQIESRNPDKTENNKPQKTWPGVIPLSLTDEVKKELNIDKNIEGVVVASVNLDSYFAVLKQMDIITSINGQKITDVRSFYRAINTPNNKNRYEIIFRRDGSLIEMTIIKD